MKKIFLSALIILTILPSSVFALVNVEAYGGYTFGGEISEVDAESVKGFGFGFRAHYYDEIAIFGWGVGGYAQFSPLNYEMTVMGTDTEADYDRTTLGFDGFITLNIPLIPLHPYVRGGIAAYDKAVTEYTINGVKTTSTESDSFGMYYGGVGLSFSVLPLPILSVQVFGEYLYEYSDVDGQTLKNHRVNIGAIVRI